MNTVFDPLMVFISEADWQDEEKRDAFLEHLLDNLKAITQYNITQIYWTDALETYLWEDPQLPPWRLDRDWKLRIVPRIYNSFLKCRKNIADFDESTVCYADPPFNALCSKLEIHNCFLSLVHFLIRKEESFYFCVGIPNNSLKTYIFHCDCHNCNIEPIQINQPDEWLEYVEIYEYWPSANNDEERKKFKNLLNIFIKIKFSGMKNAFIYDFEFAPEFIDDIIQEDKKFRMRLLFSISKRLLLNQEKAAADKGLQDEAITNKKQRRFRVTRENRIHYSYIEHDDKKKINFLKYYREGQHDNGL